VYELCFAGGLALLYVAGRPRRRFLLFKGS